MTMIDRARAQWLADNVLPLEPALRAWLGARRVACLEVDDIVQEVYAALASLDSVAHVGNPRAYVFTVAQSLILQHVRRARIISIETMSEIDRLHIPCEASSPDRHAAAHQELRHIGELIAALPGKCRQAFVLRKVNGLSQREVAVHMGISENTVEKHVGKGLHLLMDALGRGSGQRRAELAKETSERGMAHSDATSKHKH
jgi:RNA polymerase sigma-70 factor (ECF subfamily)